MSNTATSNQFALQKGNLLLLAGGFLIIIIGFIMMSGGGASNPNDFYPGGDPQNTPAIFSTSRITIAPILILFGFAVEAFAIIIKPESKLFNSIFPNNSGIFKAKEDK